MIEINERFQVAATPHDVYAVLSDPKAVVECVAGAELGDHHEDGSFDGSITIKFGALRIAFKGRVSLELDEGSYRGTMKARGRDAQGGTRFQCQAMFEVASDDGGEASIVTATGEVELSGKLASVIEGAANAVVERMSQDFVSALSVRCASGATALGPRAEQATALSTAEVAQHSATEVSGRLGSVAVLLLHGFGDTPSSLRAWGEALAGRGVRVSIPRLPGHGARWQDLNKTRAEDWVRAAEESLMDLRRDDAQVFLMGISLGATLSLRLAELHPAQVSGVVAVNPVAVGLRAAPKFLGIVRHVLRSRRRFAVDVKRRGVSHIGYDRVPLNAAFELRRLASGTMSGLAKLTAPVLLVSSEVDHVVAPSDGELIWSGLPTPNRRRLIVGDSYHLVPLDNDAELLFDESVAFVRAHALIGCQ
ncbi:MAG: alpha/beta fold hydrolase [Acidimicrobiaceae bacterium]|nr:alpha/beta fold hydrolase [Acidimicrobiaceae bacterium]